MPLYQQDDGRVPYECNSSAQFPLVATTVCTKKEYYCK